MNKTIKALADQCWDQRLDGMHFDQEKFAHLLILECARIIDNVDGAYGAPSTGGTMLKKFFELDGRFDTSEAVADSYRRTCNNLLMTMLGKRELVERWWDIENAGFDRQTPNNVFAADPKRVYNYLLRHA